MPKENEMWYVVAQILEKNRRETARTVRFGPFQQRLTAEDCATRMAPAVADLVSVSIVEEDL